MKRYYSFRTAKLSLFLFGLGTGSLLVTSATHAQSQTESVPATSSPRELMASAPWSPTSTPETQQNNADSIRVDSSVFNLDSKKPADTVQLATSLADRPESQLLQPLKYAVNLTRLQPIKQANKFSQKLPPIVSPSDVATAGLTETTHRPIMAKQTAAVSETPKTVVPKAGLAFLRKPMDIVEPMTFAMDGQMHCFNPSALQPRPLHQLSSKNSPSPPSWQTHRHTIS